MSDRHPSSVPSAMKAPDSTCCRDNSGGATRAETTGPKCPRCGGEGRSVRAETIKALVAPLAWDRLSSSDGFRFCGSASCDVAYFNPSTGDLVFCADVVVPIFQKSADPQRLVCYCFTHTVAEIQQEARAGSGVSRVAADIKARCAQGLDDCGRNNPQGSCCLGNVQRVFREAAGTAAPPPSPPEPGTGCRCCGH